MLNLVNGAVVNDAVRDPNNRIARILTAQKDNRRVVEELFLAILCRLPTEKEIEGGLDAIKDGEVDYAAQLVEAKRRVAAVAAYEKTLPAKQAKWEEDFKRVPTWTPVEVETATAKGGATITKQADGSLLVAGKVANTDIYTVKVKTQATGITALRLEVLPDPSLPAKGPGRSPNGNFVLTNIKVDAKEIGVAGKGANVGLVNPAATFAQDQFPVINALGNNPATGWAISPMFGKEHSAYFQFANPVNYPKGAEFTITLSQRFAQHSIGKFRLSVTTIKPPFSIVPPPQAIAKLLAVEPEERSDAQKAELARYFLNQDAELRRLQQAAADYPRPVDKRQPGAQDLMWSLINSKAFLFNR